MFNLFLIIGFVEEMCVRKFQSSKQDYYCSFYYFMDIFSMEGFYIYVYKDTCTRDFGIETCIIIFAVPCACADTCLVTWTGI